MLLSVCVNSGVDKGGTGAPPRVFSVSGVALGTCPQLTAKTPVVRPIESGAAAENQRRTQSPLTTQQPTGMTPEHRSLQPLSMNPRRPVLLAVTGVLA